MRIYLLETNAVSRLLKGDIGYAKRIVSLPVSSLRISAITEGGLRFGLAERPAAKKLRLAVEEFLKRVDSLPWDSEAAMRYGELRAAMEAEGKVLSPLDLLIAAQALASKALLVTSDKAFSQVPGLELEDWSEQP